jgi:hypothetical protein
MGELLVVGDQRLGDDDTMKVMGGSLTATADGGPVDQVEALVADAHVAVEAQRAGVVALRNSGALDLVSRG